MSSIPPSLQAARDRLKTNYYGLCYLSLAWQAYATCPELIPEALTRMPCPPDVEASWSCIWGPASNGPDVDPLGGPNLAYVAAASRKSWRHGCSPISPRCSRR